MSPKVAQGSPVVAAEKTYEGLVPEQLIQIFRTMYLCLLYTSSRPLSLPRPIPSRW